MRRTAIVAAVLVSGLGLNNVSEVQAQPRDWQVGGSFRSGGLHITVGPAPRIHLHRQGYDVEPRIDRFGPVVDGRGYWAREKYRGGRGRRKPKKARGVPPGHLPPPGLCRVWYDGRPPGHQPPPVFCDEAYYYLPPYGARVVHGRRPRRH